MKLTKTNTILAMTISALLLGGSFGTSAHASQPIIDKFYDSNADGSPGGEQYLSDWLVSVSSNTGINYELTPYYPVYPAGSYNVSEFIQPNSNYTWANTTNAEVYNLGQYMNVYFGNVCLGEGGAYGHGYWSNKNGQEVCQDNQAAIIGNLTALYLKTKPSGEFNPTICTDVKNWLKLKDPRANNYIDYKLSRQLAALSMSNTTGSVNGNAIVYCPSVDSIGGGISVNNLILGANSTLYSGTDAQKNAYHECLGNVNSNGYFVQSYDTCMADGWNFDTVVTVNKDVTQNGVPVTPVIGGTYNYTIDVDASPFPAVNADVYDLLAYDWFDFSLDPIDDCWASVPTSGNVIGNICEGLDIVSSIFNIETYVIDYININNTAVVNGTTNFDQVSDSYIDYITYD